MTLDKKLAELLRCPATGQAVRLATREQVAEFNDAAAAGTLRHTDGRAVEQPLEAALVTQDGSRIYPVRDGIPVMLDEECIAAPDAGGRTG